MSCVKYVHQDSSCFLACETHQKTGRHILTANSGSSEADRSDRSGRSVRPVCPVVIRVGFVLFWKFLYKPTWKGVRLPRPINIKAKANWGIPNQINTKIALLFISQTLTFSNHRLLSSFVSTAFEDVLSCLPTSEQLRRSPSRARCSRSSRAPCLHRSDQLAKPVRPVRPGFSLCWSFWRSSRVLAHSGVFGAILCQQILGSGVYLGF